MSNVFQMPKYRKLLKWREPEFGRMHWRKIGLPEDVIVMPPEYDAYLKRRGEIFRVELSNNEKSWCLYYDSTKDESDVAGWDQRGYYVRTLVSVEKGDLDEALRRARALFPKEPAFWIADGYSQERLAIDDAFDAWFDDIQRKSNEKRANRQAKKKNPKS